MAEQALKQAQDEPVVLYNLACFYVEQGDNERAIDLLERAVSLGWGDRAWMEHDSDLDPLHEQSAVPGVAVADRLINARAGTRVTLRFPRRSTRRIARARLPSSDPMRFRCQRP